MNQQPPQPSQSPDPSDWFSEPSEPSPELTGTTDASDWPTQQLPPEQPDWSQQPPVWSAQAWQSPPSSESLGWDDQSLESLGWSPPGQSLRLPDWPAEWDAQSSQFSQTTQSTEWLPQPYEAYPGQQAQQPQRYPGYPRPQEWSTGDLLLPARRPEGNRKVLAAVVGSGIVVVLVLVLCGVLTFGALGSLFGGGGISGAPNGAHLSSAAATATANSANNANNSATPTGTGSSSPTATTSNTTIPFSVSGVTASASPSNFSGACATTMTFTITATISAPDGTAGGVVTYDWQRSDGTTGSPQTVMFMAGQTTQTIHDSWQLGDDHGNGATYWEKAQVTAPNSATSSQATFSFTCRATVTSAHVVVSPTSYTCSQSYETFTFIATLQVGAMPNSYTVDFAWKRPNGVHGGTMAVTVPSNTTTVTVTDTWNFSLLSKNGSYWEEIVITSPNNVTSNQATFTKNC